MKNLVVLVIGIALLACLPFVFEFGVLGFLAWVAVTLLAHHVTKG